MFQTWFFLGKLDDSIWYNRVVVIVNLFVVSCLIQQLLVLPLPVIIPGYSGHFHVKCGLQVGSEAPMEQWDGSAATGRAAGSNDSPGLNVGYSLSDAVWQGSKQLTTTQSVCARAYKALVTILKQLVCCIVTKTCKYFGIKGQLTWTCNSLGFWVELS